MKQSWWQMALFSVLGISSGAQASQEKSPTFSGSSLPSRSYPAAPSLGAGVAWEAHLLRHSAGSEALDYAGPFEAPRASTFRSFTLALIPLAALLLSTSSEAACPSGYVALSSAGGNFCAEVEARPHVRSFEAAPACEDKGARVCSANEIETACFSGKVNGSGLGWEWSLSLDQYLSASANGSCDALAYGELTDRASLRCCLSQ